MPSNRLKEYLDADETKRKTMNNETPGIPSDSTNNELTFGLTLLVRLHQDTALQSKVTRMQTSRRSKG